MWQPRRWRGPGRLPRRAQEALVEVLEGVPMLTLKGFLGWRDERQRLDLLLCAGHDHTIFASEDSEPEASLDYSGQGHPHRVKDHLVVFARSRPWRRGLENTAVDLHISSDPDNVFVACLEGFCGWGNECSRDILAPHPALRPPLIPFRLRRDPFPARRDAWAIRKGFGNRDRPIYVVRRRYRGI